MKKYNYSDDVSLAYLLRKTEEKAKRMVNAAVEKINTFINGCHIYSLPSQLGLTGTPTMKAVAEAMPNYSIGIFNASDIDQSALAELPYGEISNIYIVRHNTYRMFALGVRSYNGVTFDGLRLAFAGYNHSDWVGWKEVVILNSAGSLHIRGNYVSNQTYSANQYSTQLCLDDSAGTNIGIVRTIHYSGGNEVTELFERRRVNGADVYNTLQLVIKPDGGLVVYVSSPAAWRAAIGAVNKSGDSLTGTLTYTPATSVTYLQGATGEGAALYVKKRVLNANAYNPAVVVQTKGGGSWAINNYNDEKLEFAYVSKANIDSQTNSALVYNIDTNGSFSGNAANVTGTVAIGHGGTGQTGLTYVNTIASIITAASGITISAAEYCQWGKVAQLAITWKSSNTISVTADGNASNVHIGTIASGKRPKMLSAGTSHGDDGGPAFYSLATGGSLYLGACGGTGSSRTIAANTTFKCWMTYLLP